MNNTISHRNRRIMIILISVVIIFAGEIGQCNQSAYAEGSVPTPEFALSPYIENGNIIMSVYNGSFGNYGWFSTYEFDGAQIFRKINDKEWEMCTDIPYESFGERYYEYSESPSESGVYQYKYRYYLNGEYGDFSEVTVDSSLHYLKPPTITSIISNGSKTTINWDKDAFATAYTLIVSTDTSSWWENGEYTISADKTSYTINVNDAYLGKILNYSLRSKNDKTTSEESLRKSVNLATPVLRSGFKTSSSQIELCWNQIAGTDSYQIYRYNPATKEYALIKTLIGDKKTSFIDSAKTANTAYSYKIKAFRNIDGRTSESFNSNTITVYTHPSSVSASVKAKYVKKKTGTSKNAWAIKDFIDHKGNYSIAYESGKYIYIRRINEKTLKTKKTIKIKKKFPKFGNILCDKNGNYYIAWGRTNSSENKKKITFAISKYNYKGKHIKTTTAASKLNIKSPFDFGNCAMAIDGKNLVCSFARLMYKSSDGLNHQASQVFAVNTKTMKAVSKYDNYVSHSFDQRLISLKDGGVLFADLGDGFPRGFHLNDNKGTQATVFHFNGKFGDNYTNSSLGDITEASTGYIFTAAANKSMKSLKGKKQLFIQVINPSDGKSILNKTKRSGTSCGKKTTDTGIKWLTGYSDGSEVRYVKMAQIDKEQILIMWGRVYGKKKYNGTYYMIITPSCKVLKKPTRVSGDFLDSRNTLQVKGRTAYWTTLKYDSKKFTNSIVVNRLKLPKL